MFRGGATAKCRSPKQATTQHHRTLTGGFHVMTCSCSHGYSHIVAISPSVWLLILSKCGFHVMISCLRSFHTTCKSCYNLFHGFVDRQRVTVWSSGCALEYFPCILHSTGVAVWVRVCFGFGLFWFAWDWAWFGLDLLWSGLGLIGRVLGGTWFCVSNFVINLFHGHGQNHQFCETLSKLRSPKIRQLCTGIMRRHSSTRYLAGLVCSQTYT